MASHRFTIFALLVFTTFFLSQVLAVNELDYQRIKIKPSASPFESALELLQKQINYTFLKIDLLRRAMTHPSFSEENNRALSILGVNVIETYVSMVSLKKDIDISPKELNRLISEISKVETSCAADGMRLGLHKMVRISPRTNSTMPSVVCGAFRGLFGAIAIDSGKADYAGNVFWGVHTVGAEKALAL